jgi:anaerobic magnesium-protoporphyrin IX monomethyl ester cyclase
MEKKILFLRAGTGWKDPSPPMAFAYLGRIAKDNGWKVFVENLNAQYNKKTINDIIELIDKEKPLIVGVTIFTNYARDSYDLIKKIKKHCKTLIAGGPHVTIYPEEALENGVDIAVVGEAESSFHSLLNAISLKKGLDKVKGIAYKDVKGRIIKTLPPDPVNLDDIPLPDKSIFRKSDYVQVKEEINNFGGILTSRGCPGICTYCYHSLFGKCFRYRSAENVFNEVVQLHKEYGVTHINFIDDAFTINKKRLMDLCDLLIKAKLPIEWVCATRIDFLDKEMILKMKEAGCVMISLGVESFIPSALIKMKKTSNPEWYIQRANDILLWCFDAKIRVGVNILTGFPWDNAEDIKKMQKHIEKIQKYVTQGFCGGILQPMPKTEEYDRYAKEYKFEKWWLNKDRIFKENYHPFFMNYYHVFWEQLQNNFFNLDKEVFCEIDKLYRMMGRWNLKIIVRRRFNNPAVSYIIYNSLFILSRLSLLMYKVSPKLERSVMRPISTFSYRFKYRN